MNLLCQHLVLFAATGLSVAQAEPQRSSKSEPRLAGIIKELSDLAERYSELEFLTPPVVHTATPKEWREMIKQELLPDGNPAELWQTSITLLGVYLHDPPRVVLSPTTVGPLLATAKEGETSLARERRLHHKATVVHELVHALQDQHYKLPTKLYETDDEDIDQLALIKGLVEGHAVFVEERVATMEWKLEDYMDRIYRNLGVDPNYHFGHRYFWHVHQADGMSGVLAQLANPPTHDAFLKLANKRIPAEAAETLGKPPPAPPKAKPKKRTNRDR